MVDRSPNRAGLAATWAGHSTVLIELDGTRLLTDPVLHHRVGPLRRVAGEVELERFDRVDAVLLSHLHADHSHLRSLRTVGAATRVLAPRGSGRWLQRHGFRAVHELGAGEETTVGAVRVGAIEATHNAHRWHLGERRLWPIGVSAEPIGYVVRGSASCYFAGDTDLFDGLSALAGSIDLALLPVSGWGAKVGSGHLNPERAATAATLIAPRVVVPIHWGTLALAIPGHRPPDSERQAREFAALVAARAPGVTVRVLLPGERVAVAGEGVTATTPPSGDGDD
jgi:L-ascorbate metabolism protein UlaG (beta-lactamase superfamily)